jgi:hypothetical protein
VLQRLKHENIVSYTDVFLHEDGQFLVVCTLMECSPRPPAPAAARADARPNARGASAQVLRARGPRAVSQ